jgi:hypothetical protein
MACNKTYNIVFGATNCDEVDTETDANLESLYNWDCSGCEDELEFVELLIIYGTDASGREACDRVSADHRCVSVSKNGDHGTEDNTLTNNWRDYDGNFGPYDGHLTDGEMCVYGEELADSGGEGWSGGDRLVTCAINIGS